MVKRSEAAIQAPAIHPGEILKEEFLAPMGISQSRLAADVGLSLRTINEIVNGRRSVTAETAMLLAAYFGVTPESWLNLQTQYDLAIARSTMTTRLRRVRPLDQAVG